MSAAPFGATELHDLVGRIAALVAQEPEFATQLAYVRAAESLVRLRMVLETRGARRGR